VLVPALLFLALAPPAPRPAVGAKPTTGADVIHMMHDRYDGKWYHTATFMQRTIKPDAPVEVWYEALTVPGSLRIDITPLAGRNVLLFHNDSIYRYADGELKLSRAFVHPLLLLGFDVYAQPVDKTVASLAALGYDMTKLHADTWQGRKVWVVGAAPGDSASKQFWIDQERLVFVRSLGPHPQKAGVLTEVQFNKYVTLGKGWIETEVLFFEAGKLVTTEEYHDPVADPVPPLDPAIFLPGPYRQPGWVKE
jgi:hypothetical protein